MVKISYVKRWTRESVAADSERIYLFGDNLKRRGFAGQACIRGLPNAIGIPTKVAPAMYEAAFFSDDYYARNALAILQAVAKIPKDAHVVLPEDGLGTGLAQLPTRAPRTCAFLCEQIEKLKETP